MLPCSFTRYMSLPVRLHVLSIWALHYILGRLGLGLDTKPIYRSITDRTSSLFYPETLMVPWVSDCNSVFARALQVQRLSKPHNTNPSFCHFGHRLWLALHQGNLRRTESEQDFMSHESAVRLVQWIYTLSSTSPKLVWIFEGPRV